jgi:hypothetical protein
MRLFFHRGRDDRAKSRIGHLPHGAAPGELAHYIEQHLQATAAR